MTNPKPLSKYEINDCGVIVNPDIVFTQKIGCVSVVVKGAELTDGRWLGSGSYMTSYSGTSFPIATDSKIFMNRDDLYRKGLLSVERTMNGIIADTNSCKSTACQRDAREMLRQAKLLMQQPSLL